MFKITINNETKFYDKPIRALELLPHDDNNYYACKINYRLRELTYIINRDTELEFLDLSDYNAMLIYQNSLRYVLCMAIHNLYPKAKVELNQFISQTFSCQISNLDEFIDSALLNKIEQEMQRIIDLDLPFKKRTVSIDEAMQIFDENGFEDKKRSTKYRPEETAHFYECDGYINYMFGYMVPSTGYLKAFKLILYYPFIVVQFPRSTHKGGIPEFKDEPNFTKVIRESKKWGEVLGATTISDINEKTESLKIIDFINMCEARHNDMLCELGDMIKKDIDTIRLITIAGPSSSGKTTFSNRLRIALLNRGITPIRISIDNYYLERSCCPLDENGNYDLEHIEALDIDLFNEQMLALIQGREVQLPYFNFKTGKREWGEKVQIDKNTPIILEGIHALNDRLTALIPKYQKFKIFIAPTPQTHIDEHNPLSYTDLRLIRRIVRDFRHRNSSAKETLSMWESVRKGEYRWIYPCQDDVDYTFNSELAYELGVMKKLVVPLLEAIDNEDEYFVDANRLLKYIKYFVDIDEKYVPCNSLLREFIGGSVFEDLK
jgi:uridine kinase